MMKALHSLKHELLMPGLQYLSHVVEKYGVTAMSIILMENQTTTNSNQNMKIFVPTTQMKKTVMDGDQSTIQKNI